MDLVVKMTRSRVPFFLCRSTTSSTQSKSSSTSEVFIDSSRVRLMKFSCIWPLNQRNFSLTKRFFLSQSGYLPSHPAVGNAIFSVFAFQPRKSGSQCLIKNNLGKALEEMTSLRSLKLRMPQQATNSATGSGTWSGGTGSVKSSTRCLRFDTSRSTRLSTTNSGSRRTSSSLLMKLDNQTGQDR